MAALESQLVINADDRTAAAFASVQAKITQLQGTISALDRSAIPALANAGAYAGPGAALDEHAAMLEAQAAAAEKASIATQTLTGSMIGTAAATAAFAASVVAVSAAVTAGADYQTQLVKLRNAGITGDELEAADRQALELSARYPNVSRVEAMEEFRAVRSVASTPEEVPGLMPTVVAGLSAMKSLGIDTEAMPNLYKAAETLGQTRDPEKFRRFIDSFVKMQQYAGHTITPETVQKFAQQMKLSGATVSDEFIEHMMFLLTQETGSRGGAGLAGLLKEFSGHIQGKEAAEWERLGFLGDADLLRSKNGTVTGIKPGHNIGNWEQALADPDLFVWTKLVPAMEKAGITSPIDQIKEVQALFENERVAAVIGKLIQQEAQFKTHLGNLQGVAGTAGADPMLETAAGGTRSLATQLQNYSGIAAQPIMTGVGEVTAAAARALGRFNELFAQSMKATPPEEDARLAIKADIQEMKRRAVEERFPSMFAAPTIEDVMRPPSRHTLGESYRMQNEIAGDREAARGAALMALPAAPAGPRSVSVNGSAQVEQTINLHITLDPAIQAQLDQITSGMDFSVPLGSAPTGRMDNDAAPSRGIGDR